MQCGLISHNCMVIIDMKNGWYNSKLSPETVLINFENRELRQEIIVMITCILSQSWIIFYVRLQKKIVI